MQSKLIQFAQRTVGELIENSRCYSQCSVKEREVNE